MMKIINMSPASLCLVVVLINSMTIIAPVESTTTFPRLNHIRTKTPPTDQSKAVQDLIVRVVGSAVAAKTTVHIDPAIGPENKDTFKLSTTKGASGVTLVIDGTSGVAATMGFYHYLKYFCHCQFTWAGANLKLPDELPVLATPLTITTADRFRYYKNVCTESYSFAFWQWDRWEREIDWMALHGINLPLAFTGQEAIFQRLFRGLGLTQGELDEFFGGPAFLAWARMGNIHGWGGPLPQSWIDGQLALQHKVLARMRSLGMTPVLPGFAGFVPKNITRVFPKAKVSHSGSWGHFNATYSQTYLLDSSDPLYKQIGSSFIQEMAKEYNGTDHVYNADTFNEMKPKSGDPKYIAASGKAVFAAMTAGDPGAVWLMQGWTFGNSKSFWSAARVEALLTSVPQGRMLLLDLYADKYPQYKRLKSFFGQPFIWCMLNNFGGITELYGTIDAINTGPSAARGLPGSSMVGTGLTPEGINVNEVMFEFMTEAAWRPNATNVTAWVEGYSQQRYGVINKQLSQAWSLLMATVYNETGNHNGARQILILRPSPWLHPDYHFKPSDIFTAWQGFLAASSDPTLTSADLFKYDLTDLSRDSLSVVFSLFYQDMITSFSKNDTNGVQKAGAQMAELLRDLDRLLASSPQFLLGRWTAAARSWGSHTAEVALLEYNARNQITLWGPDGNILDYAGKQWAGLVLDYFLPRWAHFTDYLVTLIKAKQKFNGGDFFGKLLSDVEAPWTKKQNAYPTTPLGDSVAIAKELFTKYKPLLFNPAMNSLYKSTRVLDCYSSQHNSDPFMKFRQ